MDAPRIRNRDAREQFFRAARRLALDPHDVWVGGYVDYEWQHARHAFECGVAVSGRKVLEFGCNVGATSVVLSALGATVTGVDVNSDYVELARLNAASYGMEARSRFLHVTDTRRLPFPDQEFDLVTCNSVLEYVPHGMLSVVQREIDRVLKDDGFIFVLGTSNRLWPREVHSRRWLVNYLPRFVDRRLGRDFQRGIFPWEVRFGFGPHYRDRGLGKGRAAYLEARRRLGVSGGRLAVLALAARLARPLGISVGLLTPSISILLLKQGSPRN